jgi:hypothetical protein
VQRPSNSGNTFGVRANDAIPELRMSLRRRDRVQPPLTPATQFYGILVSSLSVKIRKQPSKRSTPQRVLLFRRGPSDPERPPAHRGALGRDRREQIVLVREHLKEEAIHCDRQRGTMDVNPSSRVLSMSSGDLRIALPRKVGFHRRQDSRKSLKRWSGRWGSNPRRPAWEVNRRLSIIDLCVKGVDTRQPNPLIPRGRSSNPPLME